MKSVPTWGHQQVKISVEIVTNRPKSTKQQQSIQNYSIPPPQTCRGKEMAKRQDEQIAATGSLFSAQHIRQNFVS